MAVIGAGPTGLAFACFLASEQVPTFLHEQDANRRRSLNEGKADFYEPGLSSLLTSGLKSGILRVVVSTRDAIDKADATFVSVNTPAATNGAINLSDVKKSCVEIGTALAALQRFHIVVVRSTTVPGTASRVLLPLLERFSGKVAGKQFGLAVQPEFLREGRGVWDLAHPSRIVIGSKEETTCQALAAFYRRIYAKATPPIVTTTPTTAEMIKYASNSFLATKISFINEIANISERLGDIDMFAVAQGIGLDPRIGSEYLKAGIGYGGGCIPKDVDALAYHARIVRYKPLLLEAVKSINQSQTERIVEIAEKQLGGLQGRKVSLLGLAFKPDTDDVRNSPSITLAQILIRKGCKVTVFDPKALENARKILHSQVNYAKDEFDCVTGSDCCFVCTPWEQFESLDLKKLAAQMKTPLLVDCKMTYDPHNLPDGLSYLVLGHMRAGAHHEDLAWFKREVLRLRER